MDHRTPRARRDEPPPQAGAPAASPPPARIATGRPRKGITFNFDVHSRSRSARSTSCRVAASASCSCDRCAPRGHPVGGVGGQGHTGWGDLVLPTGEALIPRCSNSSSDEGPIRRRRVISGVRSSRLLSSSRGNVKSTRFTFWQNWSIPRLKSAYSRGSATNTRPWPQSQTRSTCWMLTFGRSMGSYPTGSPRGAPTARALAFAPGGPKYQISTGAEMKPRPTLGQSRLETFLERVGRSAWTRDSRVRHDNGYGHNDTGNRQGVRLRDNIDNAPGAKTLFILIFPSVSDVPSVIHCDCTVARAGCRRKRWPRAPVGSFEASQKYGNPRGRRLHETTGKGRTGRAGTIYSTPRINKL